MSSSVEALAPTTFDPRAFLAEQLRLPAEELEATGYSRRPHGTESATYLHAREPIGRVLVSGSRIIVGRQPRRLAIATWEPRGSACADIAPDEDVRW